MILPAIGQVLPAAIAIALSPFPVIAVVLVLATPDAKRNGVAFAGGWLVGLGALTAITLLLVGGVDGQAESSSSTVIAWLRVIAGSGLILLGVQKVRNRPRGGEDTPPPKWMAGITSMEPSGALRLGLLLGGVNPKNIALAFAASSSIAEISDGRTSSIVAGVVFVLLSSVVVVGAVVVRVTMEERSAALLDGVRRFMVDNNAVITMVVLVALGAMVLGDGLTALTA